jgi:toxin HigB-1
MIKSFAHKGLKKFFETGDVSGIQPQHADRLKAILALLQNASHPRAMPDCHPLKGKRRGEYAVEVNGPWRVCFKIKDKHAIEVTYEQYH